MKLGFALTRVKKKVQVVQVYVDVIDVQFICSLFASVINGSS